MFITVLLVLISTTALVGVVVMATDTTVTPCDLSNAILRGQPLAETEQRCNHCKKHTLERLRSFAMMLSETKDEENAITAATTTLPLGDGEWRLVWSHSASAWFTAFAVNDIVSNEVADPNRDTGWDVRGVQAVIGAMRRAITARNDDALRRRAVFMDIGANVGAYTIGVAAALGPDVRVIGVEPLMTNLQLLTMAQCMNAMSSARVSLIPVGLGDDHLRCTLISGTFNVGDGTVVCDDDARALVIGAAVPDRPNYIARQRFVTHRLDDISNEGTLHQPQNVGAFLNGGEALIDERAEVLLAVKIDIEGFELHMLRGAMTFFARHQPVYVRSEVSHSMMGGYDVVSQYLVAWEKLNYTMSWRDFDVDDGMSGAQMAAMAERNRWDIVDVFLTLRSAELQ